MLGYVWLVTSHYGLNAFACNSVILSLLNQEPIAISLV